MTAGGSETPSTDAPAAGFAGVRRITHDRLAIPGTGLDLVMAEVVYPPGSVAPAHRHPVGGLVYILEVTAESAYGDDPLRRAGPGRTHTLFRNCDPDRPLRFLTVYALEPGRDFAVPV